MRKGFGLITLLLSLLFTLPVYGQDAPVRENCNAPGYLTPRLVGGSYARVTEGQPNNVRSEPTMNAPVVTQIQPGEIVYVTSAPNCVDGLVWWQVGFNEVDQIEDFGWTAEGADGEYWLEQVRQPLAVPQGRTPITAENVGQISQFSQVEYGMVNRLVWSPDSTKLGVSTVGAVWVHDMTQSGSEPRRYVPNPADTNQASGVMFSIGSDMLFTIGSTASSFDAPRPGFRVWSLTGDENVTQAMDLEPTEYGNVAAISPDLQHIATGTWDGSILLLDGSGALLATLEDHSLLGAMQFSPDGLYLISTGGAGMMNNDPTLRVWDVFNTTALGSLDAGENSLFVEPTFSPDGTLLAVARLGATGELIVMDVPSLAPRFSLNLGEGSAVSSLSFNGDNSLLSATISRYDATSQTSTFLLDIYDAQTGTLISTLAFESTVTKAALSPDGTLLAVVTEDPAFWGPSRVTLWAVP